LYQPLIDTETSIQPLGTMIRGNQDERVIIQKLKDLAKFVRLHGCSNRGSRLDKDYLAENEYDVVRDIPKSHAGRDPADITKWK